MVKVDVDWAQVTFDWDNRFVVIVTDRQGREYTRSDVNFINRDNAIKFADTIKARGYLNADLWNCRIPYGSEAWDLDGMEERTIQDERAGFI